MTEIRTGIAVLGGGPAGYVAAIRAAQLGASVVLVEKKELGGVCMNVGCIPTKALLQSARAAAAVKKSGEYGIDSRLESVAWNTAVERKNRIVKSLNMGLHSLLQTKGIRIFNGRGIVQSAHELAVSTEEGDYSILCEKLILATGSSPRLPSVPGIDSEGVITSTEALALTKLPERIVIIGAGVIGVEFASIFAGAGVKVTVLEALPRILSGMDEEASDELFKLLKRQGISFKMQAVVMGIERDGEISTVTYDMKGKTYQVTGDYVLVAVGRKPNTEAFHHLPFELENHAIKVDSHMQTSVKDIYAAGDIIGGNLLAHLAYAEGKTAAENAMGKASKVNYRTVPSCVYTSPEYASVGLTEAQAKEMGIAIKKGSFSFRHNGRALTLGEREGFVKIMLDSEDVVVGAQILGADASELISELTLAITAEIKAEVLADMIHPHPTLSEAIWEACLDAVGRPLHQ